MTNSDAAKQVLARAQENREVSTVVESGKDFRATLDEIMPRLAEASLRKLPPEFVVSTALTLYRSSDLLQKCDKTSVVHGILQATQLGLRLDPTLRQATLIPRYNRDKKRYTAQFMPMYAGLLLLARRSRQIMHVAAQPVFEKDVFEYEYGSDQRLRHVPARGDRGQLLGHYAYAKLMSGGFQFEYMTLAEVLEQGRDRGGYDPKKHSPWDTDPIAMGNKTVLKRLIKLLPIDDPALSSAVMLDDLQERDLSQDIQVQDGKLVHSVSYDDPEVPPEPPQEGVLLEQERPVEPVSEVPPTPDTPGKPEPVNKWLALAYSAVKSAHTIKDRKTGEVRAREWAKEAVAQKERGELTEREFEEFKVFYRGLFPAKPVPEPELPFNGDKRREAKAKKTAKAVAQIDGDPVAGQLIDEIKAATTIGHLFGIKTRAQTAQMSDSGRVMVREALNEKMTDMRAKPKRAKK